MWSFDAPEKKAADRWESLGKTCELSVDLASGKVKPGDVEGDLGQKVRRSLAAELEDGLLEALRERRAVARERRKER